MTSTTTTFEPRASVVISAGDKPCRVASTNTPEMPRVKLEFGGVTVFFDPDDAHDVGVRLIMVAALLAAATPADDDREPTDDEISNPASITDDAPGSLGENDFRL